MSDTVDATSTQAAAARRADPKAESLRRADLLHGLLARLRQGSTTPLMVTTILDTLCSALAARGVAVLDLCQPPSLSPVLHQSGQCVRPILARLLGLLTTEVDTHRARNLPGGEQVLACLVTTRFGQQTALAAWRDRFEAAWDHSDWLLMDSIGGLLRIVLEHEAIERELARQARTDPLTGLLNRRAFMDEASRRIDRLDREGLPGTLIFIDLDHLKPLNDRLGHEAGDAALVLTASLLRSTVRGTDLVARLGGDEFALWLDGLDDLTAAERAEWLRLNYPLATACLTPGEEPGLTLSIGIACRHAATHEDLETLVHRADRAMYAVKRAGRGHWRVSHPERLE